MDREGIAGTLGTLAGIGAAIGAAYYLYGGGGGSGLPAGRYPIILLALIFLGPPVIAGLVVGFAVFGIAYGVLAPVERSLDEARDRRREREKREAAEAAERKRQAERATEKARVARVDSGTERIRTRLLGLAGTDIAGSLEREIEPELKKLGLTLEDKLTGDGRSALHVAAAGGKEALLEALGERGPAYLARANDGKLFLDHAQAGDEQRMLAAFTRGYTRFLEKGMLPADLPLIAEEQALFAKWVAERVEAARAPGSPRPGFDVAAFKRDTLSEARTKRGAKAVDAGQPADALEPLNSAIRLDPKYPAPLCVRGMAYADLGDHANAIRDYTASIGLKSDYQLAYYRRALAYQATGAIQQAWADFNAAIRLNDKHVNSYIDRGALHFNKRNDAAGAAADFRRALELEPENQTARDNLELAYRSANADDATLAHLDAAIESNPQDADSLAARSKVYRIRGDVDLAMLDVEEALRLAPGNSGALATRATLRQARGQLEPALADYNELIRLQPAAAWVHYNAAYLLEQLGRKNEAIAGYRKVLELEPGAQDATASLQRLGASAA
jgi:tetratricopeptide (TPR) repeat protein